MCEAVAMKIFRLALNDPCDYTSLSTEPLMFLLIRNYTCFDHKYSFAVFILEVDLKTPKPTRWHWRKHLKFLSMLKVWAITSPFWILVVGFLEQEKIYSRRYVYFFP